MWLFLEEVNKVKNRRRLYAERRTNDGHTIYIEYCVHLVNFLHFVAVHFHQPRHFDLLAAVQIRQKLAFLNAPLEREIFKTKAAY